MECVPLDAILSSPGDPLETPDSISSSDATSTSGRPTTIMAKEVAAKSLVPQSIPPSSLPTHSEYVVYCQPSSVWSPVQETSSTTLERAGELGEQELGH